jgi:two-component system sensor histidine kinase CiaH
MVMEPLSRQFGALAIVWQRNLFLQARLKLTAVYVVIVAIIVCGFSLFLYTSVTTNLYDTSDDDFANATARTHFLEHAVTPIRTTLLFTDIFIIIGAAGLSYLLAGNTLRPVQKSLEAQRLFAAQASHELRTPLTVMRNDAEVILRDAHSSPADLRTTLKSNVEEIEKMTQLVKNLLILARSEHTLPPSERVVLTDLIPNTIAKLEPLAIQKGVSLICSLREAPVIIGSVQGIERVLINLIRNAIEHTPRTGRVEVSSSAAGHRVMIQVRDSGSGVSVEDQPHIFKRFYKGQLGREKNGSGLGLAIVKEIVDQHRGSIDITSSQGNGTLVTLTFPA